jgi:hypothetical protein
MHHPTTDIIKDIQKGMEEEDASYKLKRHIRQRKSIL